jgi:phosphoribosylformylglycinamidine synthase subunit PurS
MCPEYKFGIVITLQERVNDPKGLAIKQCLEKLEFEDIGSLRMGRLIDGQITAPSIRLARDLVTQIARSEANPVTENYTTQVRYYRPTKNLDST